MRLDAECLTEGRPTQIYDYRNPINDQFMIGCGISTGIDWNGSANLFGWTQSNQDRKPSDIVTGGPVHLPSHSRKSR
jgi:hypothetical protein